MSEQKSVTARKANMAREEKDYRSKQFGTARPLLPERTFSFMTGTVDDKPHFIYE